jgi:N-hydroxyarylamine O-acetyltransferase
MSSNADIEAYLRRLGVDHEPPSAAALARLHRAQVERIPYETTWIHAGERWSVDPYQSLLRIAHQGRGGYCFHLNGAFALALAYLGYAVSLHVGGVHGPDGATEESMHNHLVLTVAGQTADNNPEGIWYVDAGLGDGLHEPLPLRPGLHDQGPFHYRLESSSGEIADWQFTHDQRGSFSGMAFRSASATMNDFARRNDVLSTSPDSGFVKLCTVQRRHSAGTDVMRGLVLSRSDGVTTEQTTITGRREWFDALRSVFGLSLSSAAPARRDELWARVQTAHRAWQDRE